MQEQSLPKSLGASQILPIVWPNAAIGRIAGIAFGVATQLVFLFTVVQLFLFLRYGGAKISFQWFWIDTLLSIGFAVPHSILLAPPTQKYLKRWMPVGLLGCLHCTVTCLTLWLMFFFWRTTSALVWKASGWTEMMVLFGFYGSWIFLFYSLYLTGMGYQTGFTQWWYWMLKKQPPRRKFVVEGIFRWMRHPVYMSFLGLIWFTPTMSLDHALLTGIWTGYIYLGSYFKDKRLLRFIGEEYSEYATRVPGLPIIGFGPLLKMRRATQQ